MLHNRELYPADDHHVIDLLDRGRIHVSSLVAEFALDDALSAFEAAAASTVIKPLIVPAPVSAS